MSHETGDTTKNRSVLQPAFFDLASVLSNHSDLQKAEIPEHYLDERIYAAEYINDPAVPNFSLARCRVKTGITTQLHSLSVDEWYVVESGQGRMEVESQENDIGPGSIVQIPKGVNQRVSNTGEHDLIFFCVCMPRFTPETYSTDE